MDEMYVEYQNFVGMSEWILGEMRDAYVGKTCNLDLACFEKGGELETIPSNTDFEIVAIGPTISQRVLGVKLNHNGITYRTWFHVENVRNIR